MDDTIRESLLACGFDAGYSGWPIDYCPDELTYEERQIWRKGWYMGMDGYYLDLYDYTGMDEYYSDLESFDYEIG